MARNAGEPGQRRKGRTVVVMTIAVTPEQVVLIKEGARARGISASAWVRLLLEGRITRQVRDARGRFTRGA